MFESTALVLRALVILWVVDLVVSLKGFPSLRRLLVRVRPIALFSSRYTPAEIARLCEYSFIAYFRSIRCLQRAATLALTLRLYGYPASLIVGTRSFPFYSHSWVEVGGISLEVDQQLVESLRELDRC